jgi:hypothetical protein
MSQRLPPRWLNSSRTLDPGNLAAADPVIAYMTNTKYRAILYSVREAAKGMDREVYPFREHSDAAFADNIDRKSSDGYLFTLYGGLIDWKAAKQSTVTTSSTKAEPLALSATTKDVK